MNRLPRVIAAHDLSGFGKASLTTVIPVLSAMGLYVSPLTTAVLSTVTGVFEGFEIVDLTEFTKKTIKHWQDLHLEFDYIYSGFLGSCQQVDVIIDCIKKFPDAYVVVDTVFADNGEMYPTMNEKMVENMRRLVSYADLITPNLTEAQYLLKEPIVKPTKEKLYEYLDRLSQMGPSKIVITSCPIDEKVAIATCNNGEKNIIESEILPVVPHGTGDLFTSVLLGKLANKVDFNEAVLTAKNFVTESILYNLEHNISFKDGVAFEKILHKLI